jgi:hypothetical protein
MAEDPQLVQLLREIRDQQRDAIALQREHLAMVQQQLARVERINERAEAIQGRAARAVKLILLVALPLVFVLLALMFFPYLSRMF